MFKRLIKSYLISEESSDASNNNNNQPALTEQLISSSLSYNVDCPSPEEAEVAEDWENTFDPYVYIFLLYFSLGKCTHYPSCLKFLSTKFKGIVAFFNCSLKNDCLAK